MWIRDWCNIIESIGCDVSCGGIVSLKYNFDVYVFMLGLISYFFFLDLVRVC